MNWLILAISLAFAMPAEASGDSVTAITAVVGDYEAGFRSGDIGRFRQAFAPDGYFVRNSAGTKGPLEATPIATLLAAWSAAPDPASRVEILGIHVTAPNLAVVTLRLHYRGMVFSDQLNLLKLEGQWRIAAKLSVQ